MLRPRYPLQFLVALVGAFLLWYMLAAQRAQTISVRGVKARLTLVNIPRDLVLTSSVPDTVSLQLRGPLGRSFDAGDPPEVLLDLADARPGINSYPINESDIPLPMNVEVVSVDPPAITLELERQEARLVPIRPKIEGVPAAGFVVNEVVVTPTHFTVQGPESRVTAMESLDTRPISIEGATGSIDTVTQPVLPDPLLRALGIGPIQVTVDIVPEAPPEDADAEENPDQG
jgi:YbbR domain-containing protein